LSVLFSQKSAFMVLLSVPALFSAPSAAAAETRIRIMPPERAVIAVGQRFDLRVEATNDAGPDAAAPRGLAVTVDGRDISSRNVLDAGVNGERGAGGTGATGASLATTFKASPAAKNTTNFLARQYVFTVAGAHVITARTADGATAQVTVSAAVWTGAAAAGQPRARNIILLLGDGMGIAHRTAARDVSRGVRDGKALAPLAMDTLEATGLVSTYALNSVITDSAPGMSSYATGQKGNNNTEGVFPDNTEDVFDNPRIEYIGEFLKRTRGAGFNVGIITTADVTDATPGANAVHTANRNAYPEIAAHFFDERTVNGVTVLMGGGKRNFLPAGESPFDHRADKRDLLGEFTGDGYKLVGSRTEVAALLDAKTPAPSKLLGLFQLSHMNVAFDKVGAGTYSEELARPRNAGFRDQPMLDDMARLAIKSLSAHSPKGFYLMIEGASIDKEAHAVDAERTIWDTIEFDHAVQAALEFADRTNNDADPTNDTLVIVTADHESGGLGIIGVGNERVSPQTLGVPVRDYAAVFRFLSEQQLNFYPNYEVDANGFPKNPDPSRKLLIGWAAAPDHFENWISNRLAQDAAVKVTQKSKKDPALDVSVAVANPARDGEDEKSDNKTVDGKAIPGFLVRGLIENGEYGCQNTPACPGDTSPEPEIIAGHTGSDVPLSASGPGAIQFTGSYTNTDVYLKMLRASTGTYDPRLPKRKPVAAAATSTR
jgi:alkaline phosphatase